MLAEKHFNNYFLILFCILTLPINKRELLSMANTDQLRILKQHIYELSSEISALKKSINPNMAFKDYREVHVKFLSLNNFKIIAKNELSALMHQYRVTLSGKMTGENDESVEKVSRRRILTEIDCNLRNSKNLDLSIDAHSHMYTYICDHFSSQFVDGKFRIKSIIQIR